MHPIDWAIVAIYLTAIVSLGIWLGRKASRGLDSFFLGDRALPWWALGASGMASNTDIAGTMAIAALIYALGTNGLPIEIRGGVVLIMAFFMVFAGKWNRRSQATTVAEWMYLRFGSGREGDAARILSAAGSLIFAIATIGYFSLGGGKFFGEFLGIDPRAATIFLILASTLYATASGFQGVIWTDVFQGVFIFAALAYVCAIAFFAAPLPETFSVSVPLGDGRFQTLSTTFAEWSRLWPPARLNVPGDYAAFDPLAIAIPIYFAKVTLEGLGGAGGYMAQRYFAARSDREAGLLSLFWILLLSFRWPFVTAIAFLGISYGATHGAIADPELVLPVVVREFVPIGIKGLLVASFMAAAMSTFDSIINASAAYWVKDIYQAYLHPQATERQLLWQSRLATVAIVAIGLLFSFNLANIHEIWGWLNIGLGAGLLVPLVLRWYWWRFNGYGFAAGTAAGAIAALFVYFVELPVPDFANFLIVSTVSLTGCLAGTFATPPTDAETLVRFYQITRPFGFWQPARDRLSPSTQAKIDAEHRRDLFAICLAVPWQLVLFATGIALVMRRWDNLGILTFCLLLLSIALYFVWFRHLSKEVRVDNLEK